VLWSEESTRRVELFEDLVKRAHAAVDAVCAASPGLVADARAIRDAIEAMAATWRNL
jgi:hypothetical protein